MRRRIAAAAWPDMRALAAFAALFIATAALAQQVEPPRALTITARPIETFDTADPSRVRFGALEFRGGLVLRSSDKDFGGWSGVRIAPDGGNLLAVSDRGYWLRTKLDYRDGRPAALSEAEIAPLLGADGKPLAARGWYDIESLTEHGDKHCVGIEKVNEIVCFNYRKDGFLARGEPIVAPPLIKTLPARKGLEAMAGVPAGQELAGALIAISERGLDKNGNYVATMIGGPRPGNFSIRKIGEFENTDAALLPGGDLVLLERRFSLTGGLGMRIRRIKQSSIKPGALVDGPVLMEADLGQEIDNMEAITAHRSVSGETILTLMSDDNFLMIQRSLLLQFALVGE